jgi:hypothetical protein
VHDGWRAEGGDAAFGVAGFAPGLEIGGEKALHDELQAGERGGCRPGDEIEVAPAGKDFM